MLVQFHALFTCEFNEQIRTSREIKSWHKAIVDGSSEVYHRQLTHYPLPKYQITHQLISWSRRSLLPWWKGVFSEHFINCVYDIMNTTLMLCGISQNVEIFNINNISSSVTYHCSLPPFWANNWWIKEHLLVKCSCQLWLFDPLPNENDDMSRNPKNL